MTALLLLVTEIKKYQGDMFIGVMLMLSFVKIGQLMNAVLTSVVESDKDCDITS
jgi:hypothetical protein